MERSVFEIDEVSGDYVIHLPEQVAEDLMEEWEDGDELSFRVFNDHSGAIYLRVDRI